MAEQLRLNCYFTNRFRSIVLSVIKRAYLAATDMKRSNWGACGCCRKFNVKHLSGLVRWAELASASFPLYECRWPSSMSKSKVHVCQQQKLNLLSKRLKTKNTKWPFSWVKSERPLDFWTQSVDKWKPHSQTKNRKQGNLLKGNPIAFQFYFDFHIFIFFLFFLPFSIVQWAGNRSMGQIIKD